MRAETPVAWTRAQRGLHWWTAALVLLAFPLGWLMVAMPLRELLVKFLLYQIHKTLGILIFALVAVRIAVRATRGRPAWDQDLPAWQRRAASAMHGLLYALLLTTPALGYLTAATAPAQVPTLFFGVISIPHLLAPDAARFAILRQVHRTFAILVVVLAAGHAAASVHNHRRGRSTLARMWRGKAPLLAPRESR